MSHQRVHVKDGSLGATLFETDVLPVPTTWSQPSDRHWEQEEGMAAPTKQSSDPVALTGPPNASQILLSDASEVKVECPS